MLDRKIKISSINEINIALIFHINEIPFQWTGLLINSEFEDKIYLNTYNLSRNLQILVSETPEKMLIYFKKWLVYTFDFDFKGYILEYHGNLFGISIEF